MKKIKLKPLLITLIIALFYPVAKALSSENKLLVFSDSCLIIALFLFVAGIFNYLVLKGDFDNIRFIGRRMDPNQNTKSYADFKNEVREERKDSFNYPLIVSLLMFFLSFITSRFI